MMRAVKKYAMRLVAPAFAGFAIVVAGCSGSGSAPPAPPATSPTTGPTPTSGPSATPTPTPTFPASVATSITAGPSAASVALGGVGAGYTATVSIPATTSGAGMIPLVYQAAAPAGTPTITSIKRVRQTIGVSLVPLSYVTFTPSATVTFPSSPAFTLTLAAGYTFSTSSFTYVGFYDPTSTAGWINLDAGAIGPAGTETFAANPVPMTLQAGVTYVFGFYSSMAVVAPLAPPSPTASPSPTPTPVPSPTPTATSTSTALAGPGTPLTGPSLGPTNGWGPRAVANALAFPVQSGFDGTGTTVAIVNDSNVLSSDLSAYLAYFQIPSTGRTVTVKAIDAASTVPGANDATEATLDLETVAGLAPGANLLLYVTPALTSQYYNDAFNQIITDGSANVVSLSFAGCESATSTGTSAIIANALQDGIAFVSASGDQGSTCFTGTSGGVAQYASGVGYPASDPNVVAVGGTETATALLNPVAWNDSLSGTQLASGGGVSTTFSIPAYQAGIAGAASTQFRNVPDIAMPAVSTSLYLNGAWQLESGTSWASPQFAAMLVEVRQYCRSSLTNTAAIPYSVYAAAGSTAFLDITSGNNAVPYAGGTSPFYTAHAGYDNVTGLGVPLGMPFAEAVCPNRAPAMRGRIIASTSGGAGRTSAYSLNVTPGVRGLTDLGERAAGTSTRIQLVLSAAPTLAASEQAVAGALQAAGFRIERTFTNHLVIDADGSSAAVEQLFATRIHDVAQGTYGTRYMPATPITVPAALAPYVAGVILDDVVNMANPNGR